jgi:hypothetical protein
VGTQLLVTAKVATLGQEVLVVIGHEWLHGVHMK